MKQISILLSVKDGEAFIAETIDSILNQTYKNFELIIVVNCSTDNTLEIIQAYDDKRIRIFESNICQLNYNLNLALSHAKGCLLYTSPSPRDKPRSRMPSSA